MELDIAHKDDIGSFQGDIDPAGYFDADFDNVERSRRYRFRLQRQFCHGISYPTQVLASCEAKAGTLVGGVDTDGMVCELPVAG